jgi:hypothetical protein
MRDLPRRLHEPGGVAASLVSVGRLVLSGSFFAWSTASRGFFCQELPLAWGVKTERTQPSILFLNMS